jgi:hypothetical protein
MSGYQLYVEMKHETDGAYLFTDGVDEWWIPKSQVLEMEYIQNSDYELTIPEWLAVQKDMI